MGSVTNVSELPTPSTNNVIKLKSKSDFLFLEELGEGSYSTVYIGSDRETHHRYAIKVCSKKQILREKKTQQIFREKECLTLLSKVENVHPFIVRLFCTFQDSESLYFVLSLQSRKDLLAALKKKKKFNEDETRFAIAEITDALGHIHKFGIIHRDVKPENILLSSSGHMILSDFGCAKSLNEKKKEESMSKDAPEEAKARARRCSFVGTAHYVSPEVLQNKPVDETCDYWALGCIIYQCLVGDRPFTDVTEYFIFKRITSDKYEFPNDFEYDDAKDLIQKLLVQDTIQRLGSKETGGVKAVMNHAFFNNVQWDELSKQTSPFLTI